MEPTVIRVVAAVIAYGDRLLVCPRPLHKRHRGLWEFPGGKCEPGETDTQTAERELREELGVDVVAAQSPEFTILDAGSHFQIVFVPVVIAGMPACHEHIAQLWGRPEELVQLCLAPSDRRYVESRLRR
jgi:8-oxo-dGTP pyrophosphatase MutT (NUDIX family)